MSKKILITGGSGFIGSHLCAHFLSEGNEVVCIDNLSTGRKDNIDNLLKNTSFRFIQGDICERSLVEDFKKENFNEIYHLASPATVNYVVNHPVEAALANSVGTKNLLDLAKENKQKILFASSSEAYGDPLKHPQDESYWGNVNPVGVRSGYDEGKRFGEALCMAYNREYDVDTKIVRIFNTYGPNSNPSDSRIIPMFISQALKNIPLTIHGDGLQTRSFCYVSDLVSGIIKTMENSIHDPVNLGNEEELTVIEVAKKIISKTKSKSKIEFVQRPKDDPSQRKPDISKARKELNWQPEISFDDGLELTIDYFKNIL